VLREDKEKDVSSYWMNVRKREDTGNWKRKHYIVIWGIRLEDTMDLSLDRLRNDDIEHWLWIFP